MRLFDVYGPEFGTLTQEFIPFLIHNQYNAELLSQFNGQSGDDSNKSQEEEIDIDTYIDSRLEPESESSLRTYAYVTSDYCV